MRLPIDITAVKFAAGSPIEPVLDYETKAPRTDKNGFPLIRVPLYVSTTEGSEVFEVKVAGEPKGLVLFQPVKVTNFVAQNWEMGNSHGISFRADAIETIKAAG
jgi:hypothetical protein